MGKKVIDYDSLGERQKKKQEKENMKKRMIEIMNRYHSGNEADRDQAKADLLESIEGFLGMAIKKYVPNYAQEYYHDLYNECVIAVLEAMDQFDPEKGTATTYFTPHLIHALSGFTNSVSNRSSSYYSANMNKIRAALVYFESRQVEPTISDLALHTGLSVQKVEQGLSRIMASDEFHYATEAELDAVLKRESRNPLDEYIEKERFEIMVEALRKLKDEDLQLLMMRMGFDSDRQLSYATIAQKTGQKVDDVKSSIARSIRILGDDKRLMEVLGKEPGQKRQRIMNRNNMELLPDTNMLNRFSDCLEDDTDEAVYHEPIAVGQSSMVTTILKFK